MKKNALFVIFFLSQFTFAQNTFPVPTGKVGIGILQPTVELDVVGTIKSYNPTPLGSTVNSFQIINDIRGNVGDNTLIRKLWLYRDGTLNNWFNSRLHDGISIDNSFATPSVDTKTWWERDPKDNIQSWGTDGVTYMTINAGNVGIGTTGTPSAKLDVNGNGAFTGGIISTVSNTIGGYIKLKNPSKTANGAASDWTIFNMSGIYGNSLQFFAYDNLGCVSGGMCSNRFTIMDNGNVGVGVTNPTNKLDVNGTIHSKEVKVDTNFPVPDYVFADDYKLRSLDEVEAYVKENSHLPEIPSAKEFEKNGINLAEMNMALLKKIEELTLYAIEQKKNTDQLTKIILEQNKRIEVLEKNTKN